MNVSKESKLIIPTDLLAAMAGWAYKSMTPEDRPHLAVVAVLGGELVATDGHRMARVPIGAPKGLKLSIRARHIAAAAAAQSELDADDVRHDDHDERAIEVTRYGNSLCLDLGTVSMTVPAGRIQDYPPVDAPMPKIIPTVPPNGYVFDPALLAAIGDIQSVIDRDDRRGVRLTAWGDADADGKRLDVMLFEGSGGARYLIMPMRDSIQGPPGIADPDAKDTAAS